MQISVAGWQQMHSGLIGVQLRIAKGTHTSGASLGASTRVSVGESSASDAASAHGPWLAEQAPSSAIQGDERRSIIDS